MLHRKIILQAIEQGLEDARDVWDNIYGNTHDEDERTENGKKKKNEQFFSSFVANELRRLISKSSEPEDFVTHETLHFVVESAIRRKKKTESKAVLGNKYDLVLWRAGPVPYAIIEIKIPPRWFNLKKDAQKICNMLGEVGIKSGGTIKAGYLGFPIYAWKTIPSEKVFQNSKVGLTDFLHKEKLLRKDKSLICSKVERQSERKSGAFRISSASVL